MNVGDEIRRIENDLAYIKLQLLNTRQNESGHDNFIGLTDTPGGYVGHGDDFPAVNVAEDGLEFKTATQVLAILSTKAGAAFDWNAQNLANIGTLSANGITDISTIVTNIAAGTTGERPAGAIGDIRYNSTTGKYEFYDGAWENVLLSGEIGIADNNLLEVDQGAGLIAGDIVRATATGIESRTEAQILDQLSAQAGATFDWNDKDLSKINSLGLKEIATPASPAAGYNKLYFKSDDRLYSVDSGGIEHLLGMGEVSLWATDDITFDNLNINAGYEIVVEWGDGGFDAYSGNNAAFTHNYAAAGNYNIRITGDVDQIYRIYCTDTHLTGNITSLKYCTSLTVLHLGGTSVSGDISNLSGLTSLVSLYFYSTSITGDISNLSGLTNLTTLHFSNASSVSGDISNLSGLTGLSYLHLGGTSVSGNVSSLSGLTSLRSLYLTTTSITGDISNLSGLTSLTSLYLYGSSIDTYTQGVLPDWDACNIYIYNLGLSQLEVDDFLCDLDTASTASVKTLNISGTNAVPSATGLTCKTSLEGKGWTVTVST